MWWRGKRGRSLLRPYELEVIDALRPVLTPAAVELLDRQVDAVHHVQRLFDDTDVSLYPSPRGRKQHYDPEFAFPNRAADLRLATVELRGPRGAGMATVHVVQGHLFNVIFRPSPKRLGERGKITAARVRVQADPMAASVGNFADDLVARLDPEVRRELEAAWLSRASWAAQLMERDEIYSIDLDDGAYMMLSQLDDTSFVVARLDWTGPVVRKFAPDGELLGDYRSPRDALS
jgi:hypothetical protein